MIYPKPLRSGDTIGVIAPSSGVNGIFIKRLDYSISLLKKFGYKCIESPSVRKNHKCTSSDPGTRIREFMDMYRNPSVKAIIPPWGGEFLMEILPLIDFTELKSLPPKWVMGFSDTSLLLYTLTLNMNMATAHGPNLIDFASEHPSVLNSLEILSLESGRSFKQKSLDTFQKNWNNPSQVSSHTYNLTEKVVWRSLNNKICSFSGRLIGGCLDVLVSIIGTRFSPIDDFIERLNGDGMIWYLESCELNAAEIYRALWQMKQIGWFEKTNGLIYGRPDGYSDVGDFNLVDALEKISNDLKIPVLYDADLGHLPPQLTFINGAYASVNYEIEDVTIIQSLV